MTIPSPLVLSAAFPLLGIMMLVITFLEIRLAVFFKVIRKNLGTLYQLLIIGNTSQIRLRHTRYQCILTENCSLGDFMRESFPKFQNKFWKEIKSEPIHHSLLQVFVDD